MTVPNLPKWRCHKEVWAVKIQQIRRWVERGDEERLPFPAGVPDSERVEIIPDDPRYHSFQVSLEYYNKHKPQPGGYFVQYADGYQSFSPAQAFEEGYTLITQAADGVPDQTPA